MNKVCKVTESDLKILRNLYQNREGLRVKTLIKLTNLKQRVIYKRLNLLKDRGLIENVFPIWKLLNGQVDYCATLLKSDNIFELHNVSYIVKLINRPEWWSNRKNRLIKLKGFNFRHINFGKGNSNPYEQLINDNFVIQTYPESVIVIAKKRYYSNSPYEAITEAISDFYDIWAWFEERMHYKFFIDGIPQAEIRNNDYNRINDALANHCKKNGTKLLIEIDKNRKVWVDYSEPFGKEANYPEGQEKLEKVTKDILLNKSLLPSEMTNNLNGMMNVVNGMLQVQQMNADNIIKHQKVLDGMLEQQKETLKTLKEIRDNIKK
jgi:hypothetical protein